MSKSLDRTLTVARCARPLAVGGILGGVLISKALMPSKTTYYNKLRSKFSEMLKHLDLDFKPFAKSPRLGSNQEAFCVEREGGVLQFLVLHVHTSSTGEFTLEFGWSTKNRFPGTLVSILTPRIMDGEYYTHDEFLNRIGAFVPKGDIWWSAKPKDTALQTEQEIDNLLDENLQEIRVMIESKIIPFFDKVVAYRASR